MLDKAFGGFDVFYVQQLTLKDGTKIFKTLDAGTDTPQYEYGIKKTETETVTLSDDTTAEINRLRHRDLRTVGVATEIYNQIIDTLSTQCMNINGRFMTIQSLNQDNIYDSSDYCKWRDITASDWNDNTDTANLYQAYGIASNENMCPRDYGLSVDVQSWGSCSCWGNGGRRSKNGRAATCVTVLPTTETTDDSSCNTSTMSIEGSHNTAQLSVDKWCTQKAVDSHGRVCPYGYFKVYLLNGNDYSSYSCSTYENENNAPASYFEDLVPEGI